MLHYTLQLQRSVVFQPILKKTLVSTIFLKQDSKVNKEGMEKC